MLGTDFCFTVEDLSLSLSGVKFKLTGSLTALDDSIQDWTPQTDDSPLNRSAPLQVLAACFTHEVDDTSWLIWLSSRWVPCTRHSRRQRCCRA